MTASVAAAGNLALTIVLAQPQSLGLQGTLLAAKTHLLRQRSFASMLPPHSQLSSAAGCGAGGALLRKRRGLRPPYVPHRHVLSNDVKFFCWYSDFDSSAGGGAAGTLLRMRRDMRHAHVPHLHPALQGRHHHVQLLRLLRLPRLRGQARRRLLRCRPLHYVAGGIRSLRSFLKVSKNRNHSGDCQVKPGGGFSDAGRSITLQVSHLNPNCTVCQAPLHGVSGSVAWHVAETAEVQQTGRRLVQNRLLHHAAGAMQHLRFHVTNYMFLWQGTRNRGQAGKRKQKRK